MSEEAKAILRRAIARFNNGDLGEYLKLYDPKAVVHGYPGVAPGIDGIRAFYEGMLKAFPDAKVTIDDLVVEGDKVACRFTTIGTNTGEFMGMPPTGRQVRFAGVTILKFAKDKCIERWSQADFMGMMQQLGAVPGPSQ